MDEAAAGGGGGTMSTTLLSLLASWSPTLLYGLGSTMAWVGPWITMGVTLFGYWLAAILAAPFALWALVRFVAGRSWALLLVGALLVAAVLFFWLIPVDILRRNVESDRERTQVDYRNRCKGNPLTIRFVKACDKSRNELRLGETEYAHVLLSEWYAQWFADHAGWFSFWTTVVAALTALGATSLVLARYWEWKRATWDRSPLQQPRFLQLPGGGGGGDSAVSATGDGTRKRTREAADIVKKKGS